MLNILFYGAHTYIMVVLCYYWLSVGEIYDEVTQDWV